MGVVTENSPQDQSTFRLAYAILICLVVAGVLYESSHLAILGATTGSKTQLAESFAIALGPALLYLGVSRPFIFPFGLYILLVPFDPLLEPVNDSFGTVTKIVGLFTGMAFLFWIIRHRNFKKPSTATAFWLLLLLWMALSGFWAIDPAVAIQKLPTYALLIGLFIVISIVPITLSEYRWVLFLVVLSGVAGSALSVYMYHNGMFVQHEEAAGVLTSRIEIEANNSNLDPNLFSASLLLPVSITLSAALQCRWSLIKFAYIAMFLLMMAGIYVNSSRGAELAVAALVAYMFVRGRFKGQLIVLSVLALGASFLLPSSPWARFNDALSSGGSGRLSIWKVGLSAFEHHWLLGAGIGNFGKAYNESFVNIYQRFYANWNRAPHDLIVQYGVELGVIGLIFLLAAWYFQWRTLTGISLGSPLFDLRIAFEAAIVSVFVSSLFLGILDSKFPWLLFSLITITQNLALSQARIKDSYLSVQIEDVNAVPSRAGAVWRTKHAT